MKENKGITLVALIITIIVMMILVAVSVAIIINSDLLGTAQNAGTSFKGKMEEEESMGTANIKINDEETTMKDYIESIGSAGGVTFKLHNHSDNKWHEFTAPSDAVWGDLFEIVPEAEYDLDLFEEDDYRYSFDAWGSLHDSYLGLYGCPNVENQCFFINADTLIADVPVPHQFGYDFTLDSEVNPDVCTLEACPYYDASLLPAGD